MSSIRLYRYNTQLGQIGQNDKINLCRQLDYFYISTLVGQIWQNDKSTL